MSGIGMNWGYAVAWLSVRPIYNALDVTIISVMIAGGLWYAPFPLGARIRLRKLTIVS